jgi:hypothetical protein
LLARSLIALNFPFGSIHISLRCSSLDKAYPNVIKADFRFLINSPYAALPRSAQTLCTPRKPFKNLCEVDLKWFEWLRGLVMGFARLNQRRHSNINWSHAIRRPTKSEITNRTRNTPNRILAIPAAAPAMLEKPSSAANNAIIRKKIDQDNM